jgi:SOS response regulatory protein OraA/RecX
VPRDAEAWLAERGIERVPLAPDPVPPVDAAPLPAPSVREVVGLAEQVLADAAGAPRPAAPPAVPDDPEVELSGLDGPQRSDDPVGAALAFIHRSTANAPQSEGRLRQKLEERGFDGTEIDAALTRARAERLVDDAALLAALITERRARGHADPRLRRDLRSRGFDGEQIDVALERHRDEDPFAVAFALAKEQATRQRDVDAEAAVRRIVGFLVRRGHSEGLARKAARDAVYADREPQRSAER